MANNVKNIPVNITGRKNIPVNLSGNGSIPINMSQKTGGGGTRDYNLLIDETKPRINDTILQGNKTGHDLGLQEEITMATKHDIDKILYGIGGD